ncbi:MAG: hypothetical protein ACI8X5_003266 [Planctomycetota bacterium]|jgi:hypothetical protein
MWLKRIVGGLLGLKRRGVSASQCINLAEIISETSKDLQLVNKPSRAPFE